VKPKGHIIFVDDDRDDHELFRIALSTVCECSVLSAYDGEEGYRLIEKHQDNIFLIISDLNMPKLNGLELKRMIENTPHLKLRAIPFIYHSSIQDPLVVKEAYALGIQGYMQKQDDFSQTVQNLRCFIDFWTSTIHPNLFR
jgi:CheY-like chemotaxis protein